MSPGLQILRVDGVLVETVPLLERFLSVLLVLVVPVEHALREVDPDRITVLAKDTLRIIEQIISIDDANLDTTGRHNSATVATADLRTDDAGVLAIVERATELIVSSLFRHELMEASLLYERRDAAAIVAGNGIARVADKEGEVELLEEIPRHHGGVARLRRGVVREWRALGRAGKVDARVAILGFLVILTHGCGRLLLGANATLWDAERRSNPSFLL